MRTNQLRLILLVNILLLTIVAVNAQTFFESNTTISWNDCRGEVEIRIPVKEDDLAGCGCDDALRALTVYEVKPEGPDGVIGYFNWGNLPGSLCGSNFIQPSNELGCLGYNHCGDSDISGRIDDSNNFYYTLKYNNLDNSLFGNLTKIRFVGIWDNRCESGYESFDFTVTGAVQQNIGTPNLQSVSTDQCGFRLVKWINQNGTVACADSKKFTVIQRRPAGASTPFEDEHTIAFPENEWEDTFGGPGDEYEYQVYHSFRPNSNRKKDSGPSSIQTGNKLPVPEAPGPITTTRDNCDSTILVSWINPLNIGTNIDFDYEIWRTYAGESAQLVDTIKNPNVTNWSDEDVRLNVEVKYEMLTRNVTCGTASPFNANTTDGYAPGVPIAPNGVMASSGNSSITVSWNDNSGDETGFIIERTFPGGGSALIEQRPANTTSWSDPNVNQCVSYSYKVRVVTDCYPNGVGESTASAIISPDLDGTFATDATGFIASKGAYTDKIELSWNNRNEGQTNTVKIYRRILESGDDFALLTTLSSASGIYNDLFADAGELYEYEIVAEGPCENVTIPSNRVRAIGFRRKTGIVTGKVSYAGGINVANVKITAKDPTNNTFPSIDMSATETAAIPDDPTLDLGEEFIIETWFKPESYAQSFDLIKKNGSYELSYDFTSSMYKFIIQSNNGAQEVQIPQSLFPMDSWNHITGMLYQDSLSLFVNGNLESRIGVSMGTDINDLNSQVIIGAGFDGKWKELRLWNIGKTDLRISQDYSRFLAGNEPGLKVYLNAGERKGVFAYDFSKIGSDFNNNHALLNAPGMWDDTDSPNTDRLSIAAFTNTDGEYNLIVPFSGAGQNFVLKPVFGQHIFDPSSRPVFIGEGSTVQNNIDFTDISTFRMTGNVSFYGTDCPSSEVLVKIDGEALVKDGNAVFTDEDGSFDIDVPIGRHVITLERNGHVFSAGRYPGDGRDDHNFQDDVLEERFIDSTFRKVIGRVVGGDREGDKVPGMGRSKNNIGLANIKFEPKKACGWINPVSDDITATTVDTSGEYEIMLPPLEYIVSRPDIVAPQSGINVIDDANIAVDLRNIPFEMTVVDTFTYQDSTIRIDSVSFHKQLDFIYKAPITIDVTNPDGSPITGDEEYIFSHSKLGTDTIDLTTLGLPFPVFTQNRAYTTLVSTFEEYINYDGGMEAVDRVPVTNGRVTLTNELAANTTVSFNLDNFEDYDGDTLYTFLAGQPNLADGSNPLFNYTKTFEAFIASGTRSDSWRPGDELFRGYVLGVEDVEESDFVTLGPELVDYILRDPPGSQSFAERIKGTSTTTENSWEWNVGGNVDIDKNVYGGTKFNLGIGYSTTTEIEATVSIGLNTETSGGEGQTTIETVTNENTWTTSADPLLAGANSDLFVGTSRNYLFGVAVNLEIVPLAACANSKIDCLGPEVNGPNGTYRVATQKNLALAGDAFKTEFIYTAAHIETYEIPQLEELRNQYLENDPRYTMLADPGSACYGANNDDPRWGTEECPTAVPSSPDPLLSTREDFSGPSYIFNEVRDSLDSVRIWNQQIRLWKEALAFNEEQKALAVDNPVNYSFGAANTSFTSSQTNTNAFTQSKTFEFFFKETLGFKVGGKIAGAGFDDTYSASLTQKRTEVENRTTENTQTVSFTISDDSEWDDFTFDVYEGSDSGGPIFKTLGGRTSCPHDARVYSKYYEPGTVLSPGTIQLEQPEITITPDRITNVPQDETANFKMTLKNNNLVGEGWEYATILRPETNLNSLAVNVGSSDDLSLEWIIPAQSSITRDVFVDIGSVYDYDSLLVVMHSTCQYQGGLSVEPDIADSAYFSLSFIPGCTDIEIADPTDQWVVNNSFNDTLDIKLSGYDYNYLNLEKIQFEYKQSSESADNWITQKVFYKDTTVQGADVEYIPKVTPFSLYQWDLSSLTEGEYDFRAVSVCSNATSESPIHRGYIDVTNPHAFGTPSPADGILDPEDDIIIRFNEDIDPAYIKNSFNIDVRGRVNGTELRQQESLQFDGVSQYGEIPEYQLQKRSFTIEFWAQRNSTGQEIVFSQGVSTQDQLLVGFDGSNQLYLQLEDQITSSNFAIIDNDWHFYAVVYDRSTQDVRFFVDNTPRGEDINFFADYSSTGPIFVGKNSSSDDQYFQGNLQELRLWSIVRDQGSIGETSGITLSGREPGLIGNWPLDDSWGDVANEKVRGRHLAIAGASWNVDPPSHSYKFENGDYLVAADAGQLATTSAEDMTIEGWFKTDGGSKQTIMSNGIPSASQPSWWSISVAASGHLLIENNGNQLLTDVEVNDNTWHHFSLVVERGFATSLYLEGDLVETANSSLFGDFGAAELILGAQVDGSGVGASFTQHFVGHLDDIRIWNIGRKPEQIGRDFINQLIGDEPGLLAYYPFDDYVIPSTPIPTLMDHVVDTAATAVRFDLMAMGGSFSNTRPTIKLPRVIKSIPKTFSVNGDEMFISLDINPADIENVTLDITVLGIRDFAGNRMEPAETWVAYIDKNQVFWDTEYFEFEKDIVGDLTFSATIKNTGGSQERFDISNVPSWLRASSTSGIIEPNSSVEIDFTILSLLNIGEYEQDIYVTTDFGFNERLLLDLKITAEPPVWEIDPNAFDYSMNLIGELKINDVISTDEEDMVSVWINDELRGVTHVERDPVSGKHLVFLTISSDVTTADDIEFRAWDASLGRLLVGLTPSDLKFQDNSVVGSLGSPLPIGATVLTQLSYYLKSGWNWISFPLDDDILSDVNETLTDLSPTVDDEVTAWNRFDRFYATGTWRGGLDATGFNTDEGYKIFVAEADTFRYEGLFYDPKEEPITIEPKWNWIGMKGEINLDINTALQSLNPSQGDVIKGQQQFAIYDTLFGWSGNLDFLSPQVGYMYNSATLQSLVFPGSGTTRSEVSARDNAYLKSQDKHPYLKNVESEVRTYSSNMSLTAAISECLLSELSGKEIDLSEWMLSTHVGDEDRGATESVWQEVLGQHLFYLTIAGDGASDLEFRLIKKDGSDEIHLNQGFSFSSNEVIGAPSSPYLFTCGKRVECVDDRIFNTEDFNLKESLNSYKARYSISSDAEIPYGIILQFKAGEKVELFRGFEAIEGAGLEVSIDDCIELND